MKLFQKLAILLTICTFHLIHAMDFIGENSEKTAYAGFETVPINSDWWHPTVSEVPDGITCVPCDHPLSDELLLGLNPEWLQLKARLSKSQKQYLLEQSIRYYGSYEPKRILCALAICIGAKPTKKPIERYVRHSHQAIGLAVMLNDWQLITYILTKSSTEKVRKKLLRHALKNAQMAPVVEFLIGHGVEIPTAVLERCCDERYPAELMKLYLDNGVKPQMLENGYSLLHCLVENGGKGLIEKTCLLLKAGVDISTKNAVGNTALHCVGAKKRYDFMKAVVAHHSKQSHRQQFFSLLLCIKKNSYMYPPSDVRKLLFGECANCFSCEELRDLLRIKGCLAKTLYELCDYYQLYNPDSTTWKDYKSVRAVFKLDEFDRTA